MMDESRNYAVRVSGYSCLFYFDLYENVVWFMEMCGEDGNNSVCFKRNELGQYEKLCWTVLDDNGD